MAPRKSRQLSLDVQPRTWGGKRAGAGRKTTGTSAGVPHRPRPLLERRLPIHVTLRMTPQVYNLRSQRCFRVITTALAAGADRFEVRVVQFSVQGNHIHLLVEADSRTALARALKGLSGRIAKRLNVVMKRHGRVLADRYHAHVLRTPTEVRRAMTYIRDNARLHAAARAVTYSPGYVDPCSSAAVTMLLPQPRTWLVREGWRRGS